MALFPRDPRNAPGDFYVVRDQCISCGVPEAEAPELVSLDDDGCYFRRQPETPDEVDDAIEAIRVSCVAAYRYGGTDISIRTRLSEGGAGGQCDHPLDVSRSRRDHVRFMLVGATEAVEVLNLLLVCLQSIWRTKPSDAPDGDAERAEVSYHLGAGAPRRYTVIRVDPHSSPRGGSIYRDPTLASAWLLVEEGGRYPLGWLHELLIRNGATNLQWFSAREWDEGRPGAMAP